MRNDRIKSAFDQIHADEALINNTAAYVSREAAKRKRKDNSFAFPARLGAALGLIVICLFSYSQFFAAAAHISIDINPSLELALNRYDRVIGAYAFNDDGALILDKLSLRGKSYEDAAALIFSAVGECGYLSDDSLISITVQAANEKAEQKLCQAMTQFTNEAILPVSNTAQIEVFPVSSDVWGHAHGRHLSPAKYLAIRELEQVDDTATIEDYQDASISQIRQRTHECRNMADETAQGEAPPVQQSGQGHGGGNGSGSENGGGHGHGNGHGHGGG